MAKEIKIGLAVVGALFAVFGGLLVRHMFFTGDPQDLPGEQKALAVAAETAGERANVIVAQHGTEAAADDASWSGGTGAAPVDAQAPSGSYMPAEDEPAPLPNDPYADPVQNARQAGAAQPPGRSPFQDYDAGGEPQAPGAKPRENPLRQLNAELPLETSGAVESEEAGAPDPQAPGDPYTADPAATRDPFAAEDDAAQAAPREAPSAPAMAGPDDAQYDAADLPQAGAAAGDRYSADEGPVAEPAGQPGYEPAAERAPAGLNDWQPGEGSEPAEPARPLAVEDGKYTVQPGDTLWSISEGVYGTGGYFKALAEHNRNVLPRSHELTVGQQVEVPPATQLERDYPGLCPKQRKSALVPAGGQPRPAARTASGSDVYIVAEGDTLFDIARYELGKASRWAEIYELNRELLGEDFDYLRPGTELAMPPRTRPAASISRGEDEGYRR